MELEWEEIHENQRWMPARGWIPAPGIPIDPPRWTNVKGQKCVSPNELQLPQTKTKRKKTKNNDDTQIDIRVASANTQNDDHMDKLRWIWAGEWRIGDWRYAISFGSTLNLNFKWAEKQKKQHFVRRRLYRRPRIRMFEEGSKSEVTEYIFENERRVANKWFAPYFPGDRPHYSTAKGVDRTTKDIELSLPSSWSWKTDWEVEIGEHTDHNGWEYSIDFLVDSWSHSQKILLHNVRRRKWIRVRVLKEMLPQAKKLKSKKKSNVNKKNITTKGGLTEISDKQPSNN